MTKSPTISRSQLLLGICLPLALLMGYLLAEPLDPSGMGLVLLVVAVLVSPVLIWWYHPMLIGCWNAVLWVAILPGNPMMWMLMTVAGFGLAVLSRAINPGVRFATVPALNWVLVGLLVVVFGTAYVTGGVGMNALGSQQFGGRNYFLILLAILGYYTLTSRTIPVERAGFYCGLFFLPGLTALMGNVIYMLGQGAWFLFMLFPVGGAYYQYVADTSLGASVSRFAGAEAAAQAVWCFMLARYGIAGVFDFQRPWRIIILGLSVMLGLLGGFRSAVVVFGLVFIIQFSLERLWRTRLMFWLALLVVLGAGSLALFSRSLPLQVQRAVSILPVEVDPVARMDAENSTQWRLEMWRRAWPEVPQYLFKGKGYNLNPHDMGLVEDAMRMGYATGYEMAFFAGDYHNGPLSVLLPFGIYGAVAFLGLFSVGGWVLWRNWQYGREELKSINRFLFALFLAKVIFFLVIFGSAYSDLAVFTGLLGLAVSLNGGVAQKKGSRA